MVNFKCIILCMVLILLSACVPPTVNQATFTPTPPLTPYRTPTIFPPTVTPWPDAPILRSPLDVPFACTGESLEVELVWSPSRSEHPVQRYLVQIERATEASGSWERVKSDFVSGSPVSMELECGVATFYRWRVQTQDVRGSIGPWSDYAFFSLVLPGG